MAGGEAGSADRESSSWAVLGLTAVVGAFILLFVFLFNLIKKSHSDEDDAADKTKASDSANGSNEIQSKKKKEKPVVKKRDSRAAFSHQWLACTLRSHSGSVLGIDFSPNGKYLASCSEDRTILVWNVKEFNKREHKSFRANVELDHATKVRFSPDSRAFIVSLFSGETIRVFRMGKKDENLATSKIQAAFDFPQKQSVEIINIGIASNGKFIMTCHRDTTVKIWDIKGELLHVIDTHQMNNTHGLVSPCGRFVATSGFTPDVKVWEVCFDKSGSFKEVTRAFELKGHTSGVHCFAFSNDSRRMASVSKDGTWRFWDTNVEYQKKQDPYLLKTWKYDYPGPSLIALSPDARTVALATGTTISVYNVASSDCQQTFEDVHSGDIAALEFSIDSSYLVSCGDKHINVFFNVVGFKGTISELEEKQKAATTQALRERLQQQIEGAKSLLKSVETKS